jgi:hypothetical protein
VHLLRWLTMMFPDFFFLFIPQTLPKNFKFFLLKHFLKRFSDELFKKYIFFHKVFLKIGKYFSYFIHVFFERVLVVPTC